MKRLGLALALALWAGPALAQNVTCSTRPSGDSSNACASTAFVTTALGGGAGGVTSIQGMTGALTCGANMSCTGQVMSAVGGNALLPSLVHTHIFVGNASNAAADFGVKATFTDAGLLGITPNVTTAVAPDAPLTINANTVSNSIGITLPNVLLHLVGDDTSARANLTMDAFAFGFSGIVTRSAGGTAASKLPIAGSQNMFILSAQGWNGNAYATGAQMHMVASENYSTTANGAFIQFFTTPTGTPTVVEAMRIQPSGGLSIGSNVVDTDPGNGNIFLDGIRLFQLSGTRQCLNVDPSGAVGGTGAPCADVTSLTHSHILVGSASGVATDFGSLATFADNGLMTFAINTGGVGNFYNVMSSTVPLNTAVIAWRLTDNVNNTVDFGLTGNGAPAPFTGTSFIRSSGNFIIDANTPSAIIFGIGLVEAGRWDQNGHLQLTYLAGGGNQCLTINGAGVVSGTGASCGGGGGGGGGGSGVPGGSNTQVQYNSLGSFAGAAGVTTNGTSLTISGTAASGINTLAVSQEWSASGGSNLIGSFTSYGDVSRIVLRRANGTQAAPSPVNFGDNLGGFGVRGYTTGGAFTAASSGAINIFAGETFTATAQGTYMTFNVNGVGGATPFTMNASTTGIAINATNLLPPLFADAPLTINANTVTTVAPNPGTVIHVIGADTTNVPIMVDGFGGQAQIAFRRANGTAGAKLGITANTILANINVTGWDTAIYGGGGGIRYIAAEDWSATNHGLFVSISTVGVGPSVSTAEALRIQPSGGLSIGNTNTATDGGNGILVSTGARFTSGSTTGATRCLHVDTNGNVSGTASDCGATAVGGGVTGVTSPGGTLTVGGTTGVTVDLNLAHSNTFTVPQAISNQTASSGVSTFAVSQDWSAPGAGNMLGNFTSYGDVPRFVLRRANGTQAASTPVKANDAFATFGGRGYTSAGVFTAGNSAAMSFIAAEDFTATGQGSFIEFNPSPLGGGSSAFLTSISTSGLLVQAFQSQVLFADAPLTINANTVAGPAPGAGTVLHMVGADSSGVVIVADGFSGFTTLAMRRAMGTAAAKLPMDTGGRTLAGINGAGWNGTAYVNSVSIGFNTAEAFDATHSGGSMTINTTAAGTTGARGTALFQASGGFSVGSANVGTDLGDGVIAANTLNLAASAVYMISLNGLGNFTTINFAHAGGSNAQVGWDNTVPEFDILTTVAAPILYIAAEFWSATNNVKTDEAVFLLRRRGGLAAVGAAPTSRRMVALALS